MLDAILNLNLPRELIVILIGATPIFELRGAIPYAILQLHYPWHYALLLSIIGNMLPVPFLLLFWNAATRSLSRIGLFKKPIDWLFARTQRQSASIGKYKFLGLLVFVAIPLPLTGAWTASLVAIVLGMKFGPAFWSIFGGVIVAGFIMLAIVMGFSIAFSTMGWIGVGIVTLFLTTIITWAFLRNRNHSPNNKLGR